MSVNIKSLVLQAIEETIQVVKHQSEKQRPIENINTHEICNRFFHEKVEKMKLGSTNNVYWISAFIESEDELDEALELEQVIGKLKDGFTSGFDRRESQQFVFDVQTLSSGYSHAFDIAFELLSKDPEGADVTASKLRKALQRRLKTISDNELIEACGAPFDSCVR